MAARLHVSPNVVSGGGGVEPDMHLAAILFDLGKAIVLKGNCRKMSLVWLLPIIESEDGAGLDNRVMQWISDEFTYLKLRDYLLEPAAWLRPADDGHVFSAAVRIETNVSIISSIRSAPYLRLK